MKCYEYIEMRLLLVVITLSQVFQCNLHMLSFIPLVSFPYPSTKSYSKIISQTSFWEHNAVEASDCFSVTLICIKICVYHNVMPTNNPLLWLWSMFGTWWRHQMETFSALLAIYAGNSPVSGEFPAQRPVTLSFDIFFDLRLNKRLSKQSWGWWFETLSCPFWRQCNEYAKLHQNEQRHNDPIGRSMLLN